MNLRTPIQACALLAIMSQCFIVVAFETDQYNLPPIPLADIGDEVAAYAEDNIRIAIEKLNAEIEVHQTCSENFARANCEPAERRKRRLEYLRSETAVAREVFKRLGDGIIPFTRSGTWMNSHEFRARPARYRTGYQRSIFVYLPTNYLTISPTVNLYGASFGTDKIAHFFQQGYTYYKIRERAIARGDDTKRADLKAVRWGQMTEGTYYGTLVSGVFSNADLYANYAGMRFYQGLTNTIQVAGVERPAMVSLVNGKWAVNLHEMDALLRPFISDHLNEALNPSLYIPGLRSSIRRIVKRNSCAQWRKAFAQRDGAYFTDLTRSLKLWHGEDYGFKNSEKFVTIGNTCY